MVAAVLYALGGVGRVGAGPRGRQWRESAFYLGVLTVFVALEPPFDNWADTSFAMHMAQHVLLLTAAPPLLGFLVEARFEGRSYHHLVTVPIVPVPALRHAVPGLVSGTG